MVVAVTDPFVVAIDDWVAKVRDRQDRIIQLAAQMALERIKQLTPVKTGYLRANWTVVRGSAAEALMGAAPRPEESQATILRLHAGDEFTLLNATVYAARINYGFVGTNSLGRHYEQSGAHMVEKVVTELPDIFEKAAARIAAEG